MSEIITKGYLIARIDYQVFDEIITFINEYGNRFVCLAQGVKKITSKNARNLQIGNYCEFQFFLARNEGKISKLKKINVIKQISWPIYRQSFFTLNNLVNQLIYPNKRNYLFYDKMLNYSLDEEMNDNKAELIILRNYCYLVGLNLHIDDCVICHSKDIKTISFKKQGLLCKKCSININQFEIGFTKLVYFLFKNEYDQMDQYEKYYLSLLAYLKQYIRDNNGTYFS